MNNNVLSLFETTELKTPGTSTALGPTSRQDRKTRGSSELLGHLLWTSVSDCVRFEPSALRSLILSSGLDATALMPSAPRAASALTRAALASEVRRESLPGGEGLHANIIFRVAARGARQMVTETLNAQARLSYEPVAAIQTEESGELTAEKLLQSRPLHDVEYRALKKLQNLYEYEKIRHDADAARRALLKALRIARGIPLRASGGMYFVPISKQDTTQKLLTFIGKIRGEAEQAPGSSPNETHAARVELMDSAEYRSWVSVSLEDFIQKESEALIKEMTNLLKSDTTVTPKRQGSFLKRVRALRANVDEYENLLEYQATDARTSLELAGKEARKLLDKIEAPEPSENTPTQRAS